MLKVKANSRSKSNLSNSGDNLTFSKDTRMKLDKQNTSSQRSEASTESRRGKLVVTANNPVLKTNLRSNKENIDQNIEKRSVGKK